MAIDTVEQAYGDFCRTMPGYADEARQVALNGGVHRITITVRNGGKRGLIASMEVTEARKGKSGGNFLDLK